MRLKGDCPSIDLNYEKLLHTVLRHLAEAGLIESAHDCADGGLAVALAESCIQSDHFLKVLLLKLIQN